MSHASGPARRPVIDFDVRRGVQLRIRGSATVSAACVFIEGSLDGGPWSLLDQAAIKDGAFDDMETVAAGRLRWRAVFRSSLLSNDAADAAEPQQGELLLEPGKDVDLVIPVVPKR